MEVEERASSIMISLYVRSRLGPCRLDRCDDEFILNSNSERLKVDP